MGTEYLDEYGEYICLSDCLSAYMSQKCIKTSTDFLYMLPVSVSRYVMYFWFNELRHVPHHGMVVFPAASLQCCAQANTLLYVPVEFCTELE